MRTRGYLAAILSVTAVFARPAWAAEGGYSNYIPGF